MVKKRVHELAKELNIESKELMQKLGNMGISVKSPLSALQDADVERVLAELKGGHEKTGNNKEGNQQAQAPAAQVQARPDKLRDGIKNNHKKRHPERPRHQQDARRYDRGPGLVDRVPSRPPDRRFQERPLKVEPPQPQQPKAQQPQQAQQFAGKVQQHAARARGHADGKPVQAAPPQAEAVVRQPARTRPEQLKVPKVPQEIKAVSEKVRSDKTRGEKKQEKQHVVRERDRKEFLEETVADRKLRPLASQKKKAAPREPEVKP
ncbi:MAG: translation initiation factor IF-2 N-terminal domain-containing protein, partial [Desulfofundulus sp.]